MISKITLTTLLLGICGHVYSCKCDGPGTIKESFKGSSVIVRGRVVGKRLMSFDKTMNATKVDYVKNKLRDDKEKLQLFLSDFVYEIRLLVKESFRGSNAGDTLTIYTTTTSGSCGYRFDLDKEYIVYTLKKSLHYFLFLSEEERKDNFERENTYWAHACTRTTEYNNAEAAELRQLQSDERE